MLDNDMGDTLLNLQMTFYAEQFGIIDRLARFHLQRSSSKKWSILEYCF